MEKRRRRNRGKEIDKHRNKVDTKYLPKSHLTVSRNLHLKEIMPIIVFLKYYKYHVLLK